MRIAQRVMKKTFPAAFKPQVIIFISDSHNIKPLLQWDAILIPLIMCSEGEKTITIAHKVALSPLLPSSWRHLIMQHLSEGMKG